MKLVLMGTNSFVVPIFEAIRQSGHEIMAVFTRAPKPVGRKQILTPSPVHNWALEHNLPLHTSIKEYNYSPDMVVVISYGVILRDNVLNSAPCINIHPSLLPLYRGPSPIRTAIYNGDEKSGVCLMQVTPEMDAGDIYQCRKFDIDINDTNETVENIICLPKTGEYIYEALKNTNKNIWFTNELKDAVNIAKMNTKENMACLLSPAASSYGYFKNFEERGNLFKKYVLE